MLTSMPPTPFPQNTNPMALSLAVHAPLAFSAPVAYSGTRALHIAMQQKNVGFQDPAQERNRAAASAKAGEFCYGLPGALAPVGNFDPFNLLDGKTFEQVRTWREAELAHCRVGMLSAAGFLVQEKFHPLFSGDGGTAFDQFDNLPPVMWVLITLGIGACESLRISVGWSNPSEPEHVFQKLKPEYVPGDIGFDPLGLKPTDPEEFRIMQTKELQNGRLAMLAAAGFLAQEFATGSTWGTYFGRPDL
eukprot:jgi/Chrpa1/9023/Chrysochromulina_OHIO_Genome00017002-RA